jgi:hypothetical protein
MLPDFRWEGCPRKRTVEQLRCDGVDADAGGSQFCVQDAPDPSWRMYGATAWLSQIAAPTLTSIIRPNASGVAPLRSSSANAPIVFTEDTLVLVQANKKV